MYFLILYVFSYFICTFLFYIYLLKKAATNAAEDDGDDDDNDDDNDDDAMDMEGVAFIQLSFKSFTFMLSFFHNES